MGNNNFLKILSVLFILLIFLLALSFKSQEVSGWKLVYENSPSGEKVSGDIEELMSNAMNGSDVKVILHFYPEDLHYQMSLSKVKIDICNKIITGYNYDFRQNQSEKDVYSRISTYSTTGEYISIYEDNNYYRNPEVIKVAMSWYVND